MDDVKEWVKICNYCMVRNGLMIGLGGENG